MKNVIFTLLCILTFSCVVDDDNPLNDKLKDKYLIVSMSDTYSINGNTYNTDSFKLFEGTNSSRYEIGLENTEHYGLLLKDTVKNVLELVSDTALMVCIFTPTIYGNKLGSCTAQITDFTYLVVDDSTLNIRLDSAYMEIPKFYHSYMPDTVYYITSDLTINTTLK